MSPTLVLGGNANFTITFGADANVNTAITYSQLTKGGMELMTLREMFLLTKRKQSDWQTIFASSKANGAAYQEPPRYPIQWPESTWLQGKLKERREVRGK
jgi:hypothetical protein